MKANELRIGNIVKAKRSQYGEKYIIVESVGQDAINISFRTYWLDELEPIPLTEDWLVKFGFKKRESSVCDQWWNGINDITHDWLVDLTEMKDNGQFFYRNGKHTIKYVHQLQNLYFALTGTELELTIQK